MKRKHLLLTLLLALLVPLAALAQVERTATVYNGTDKECHVPVYGNLDVGDRSLSQFIMDKNVLQATGLAGKQITKMAFHLANPVPSSYQWTTPRYTKVTLAEVDASELDADGNVLQSSAMTNPQLVANLYLDAHGETMEVAFSSPYTYSGEKNLLVQFEEQYQFYPGSYTPFGPYRLPMFYGVYKDGVSGWNKITYSGTYPTRLNKYNFLPKTTFTYLADEANFFNTRVPQNARTTTWYDENNGNFNYKIQLQWDAPANHTGNYRVLCVPRGTSTLDWDNAVSTSNTSYTFDGLQKNTAYDLYVIARLNTVSGLISAAATASATTPFYPANLNESDLVFDFETRTMPNGLTLAGNDTYLVRPYKDYNIYSYNELGYYNVGSFDWLGRQHYLETSPLTITLPELKFTNATNGLMVEFDLIKEGVYVGEDPAEVLVRLYDHGYGVEVFSATASTGSSNRQHFTYRLANVTNSNGFNKYRLSFSSVVGGTGFTLDNIVVRKAPDIIPAYNLAANNIMPNSATISWTDDNTNTHSVDLCYRYKGYHGGEEQYWEQIVENVTSPYTLTGLTPYTDYEVKVKTITGSAYEDSEILEFSTLCTPATVPFHEPFTGLTALPTDWRVNRYHTNESYDFETVVGNGRLTLNNIATEVSVGYGYTYTSYSYLSAYIILPYFNDLGTLQLSFKAGRTQGTMENISVGVVAAPNNYASYTEIGTATLTNSENGEVYSYNLVNNAVQSGHIVIYFNKYESNLQSIWFDDFVVQQYAAPTGLAVSSVTNTSATLSWNAGAATEWEVQYKEATASTWTTVTPNPASNSCTLTGLTASSDYVAQVRAKYGESYSDWVSVSFKTLMQEAYFVYNGHNYGTENFSSGSVGWQFLNVSGMGGYTEYSYGWYWGGAAGPFSINGVSTNKSIYISSDNGTSNNYSVGASGLGMYVSFLETTVYAAKTFNLTTGNYTFSYKHQVKGVTDRDYARVALVPANVTLEGMYGEGGNDGCPAGLTSTTLPNGWIALDGGMQLPQYNLQAFTTKTVSLQVYEGGQVAPGDYMLVFIWHQDAGSNGLNGHSAVQNPIAIDDVSIQWSSLFNAPTELASVPSDNSAALSWTAPEAPTGFSIVGYEAQYTSIENDWQYSDTHTTDQTSWTLTGLQGSTDYWYRVRAKFSNDGGTTVCRSEWSEVASFTTLLQRPLHVTAIPFSSSMAQIGWDEVSLDLQEGQSIVYAYQLKVNGSEWGYDNTVSSPSKVLNFLPVGEYALRVKTTIRQNGSTVMESPWSGEEGAAFAISAWSDAVTIFPRTYDFDASSYALPDGFTVDGYCISGHPEVAYLSVYRPSSYSSAYEAHSGDYVLKFRPDAESDRENMLVLPPMRPTTSDMLLSFWWHHDSDASYANLQDGVYVESSYDGETWQTQGQMIMRYGATTGWAQYTRMIPAALGNDKVYVRLRFVGDPNNAMNEIHHCWVDDITVRAAQSVQPYIYDINANANTATLTVYDYAFDDGIGSSCFQVQYRKVGDEWTESGNITEINNVEAAFSQTLTVSGLDPNTYYEFRVRAKMSGLPWSGWSETYLQWTSNGVFTVTPTHPYEHDFELGAYNWTIGDGWQTQCEGGYNGSSYCAFSNGSTEVLMSPEINFSGCDNVIVRFWAKGASGQFRIYSGTNFETVVRKSLQQPSASYWRQYAFSLSQYMAGTVKIGFAPTNSNILSIDDIEIVANAYDKVFDVPVATNHQWSDPGNWWPHQLPTSSDRVFIHGTAYVGESTGNNPITAQTGDMDFSSASQLNVYPGSILETPQAKISNITCRIYVYDGGQIKVSETTGNYVGMFKNIMQYNGDKDHYYLLAPTHDRAVNNYPANMLSGSYDLYKFDGNATDGLEWRNYETANFALERGKGYLYSRNVSYTLMFAGSVLPVGEHTIENLTYGPNTEAHPFYNWNLVGNPFPCNAYLSGNRPFYRLEETAEGSRIVLATDNAIKPMEGVFVQAETEAESTVTFTTTEPTRESGLNFTLSKQSESRGTESVMADRAIIRFGEGQNLGKLNLMADPNRLYIPMQGKDMAVVFSQPVGELPLNFEAAKNGTYTLSFENATEGLMYCHLIDNKTGADIDLLQQPEYTFEASYRDYPSRFKVVFVSNEDGSSTSSETFAFENNGNWIVLNEGRATLQVVDLTGRVLSSEQIEGSVQTSIHQPAGLYLIRLVRGDDVRVQKVVVR